MAARSSGIPAPARAEVAMISGKTAGLFRSAAVISARRAARLFDVPLSIVNDAVDFERSLMAA